MKASHPTEWPNMQAGSLTSAQAGPASCVQQAPRCRRNRHGGPQTGWRRPPSEERRRVRPRPDLKQDVKLCWGVGFHPPRPQAKGGDRNPADRTHLRELVQESKGSHLSIPGPSDPQGIGFLLAREQPTFHL